MNVDDAPKKPRRPTARRGTVERDLPGLRRAARCPVVGQAARTQQTAEDLGRALHKLRRDMRRCERCAYAAPSHPGAAVCPLPNYWNAAINSAIQAAVEGWEQQAQEPGAWSAEPRG